MGKNSANRWLFFGGLLVALILGFMPQLLGLWGLTLLVLVGLAAGYLNIKSSESIRFLVATIALPITAGGLNAVPVVSSFLGPILVNIAAFTGAAAIVVALASIWHTMKN